jgi:metallo-beta-lactamase class B
MVKRGRLFFGRRHRGYSSMIMRRLNLILAVIGFLVALSVRPAAAERMPPCPMCATWNQPQAPFRVFGNTYYVGPRGLAAILITSPEGHVLIDGALPESAAGIAASVKALGFRVEDIKVILNTHVHYDHAGGIAELQRLSGAKVWASPWSARVLDQGTASPDDPQASILHPLARVKNVALLKAGGTVKVGPLALVAHFTPGHTGGGTSWSWRSCEAGRCLDLVYADSLTPVSSDDFRFTGKTALLRQFEAAYAVLDRVPCDLLLTPHPEATQLWQRLERRDRQGERDALVDRGACKRYVSAARQRLQERLARESAR